MLQSYTVIWDPMAELLEAFERSWRISRYRATSRPRTLFDRYYPQ